MTEVGVCDRESPSLLGLAPSPDDYRFDGGRLRRSLSVGEARIESWVMQTGDTAIDASDLPGAWWQAYLDGFSPASVVGQTGTLRVVDLFSGAGGLALGVRQLAAEAGRELTTELCCDTDAGALAVYDANHRSRIPSNDSVSSLVDYRLVSGRFAYSPEILDEQIARAVHGVDLVMAGPPCQGHSNLNNHTRRDDARNALYFAVPAFAVAAEARTVVIENVPEVVKDRIGVVDTTRDLLESAGYRVTCATLAADAMGWPQTRKRFFLVARHGSAPIPLEKVAEMLHQPKPRSVWWAIGSRQGKDQAVTGDPALDKPGKLSPENRQRIAWLFDNKAYDLDLAERPDCHKNGTTYGAVYGRMRKNEPAGTITTGFMTPGRGRFVHPTRRRTLTPAEAARLQGFPKNYRWRVGGAPPKRSQLAKWIGDAVPMPLGYAAALSALAPDFASH